MDAQAHWNSVYGEKEASERSWHRPHLETSVAWIERSAENKRAPILDVGGGESTLAEDLLALGYGDLTVLDISQSALERAKKRPGLDGRNIAWVCGDILSVKLPKGSYSVWHDRAVFHFLTERAQRAAYIRQAASAVRTGGHVIVATFGPEGPKQCSGLDVMRYEAGALRAEFGDKFRLIESVEELHRTPSGATQPFVYCDFVVV